MDNNELGEQIRKARGELSLREFAKRCGISHTHLDSIEKGVDPRTGKPVSISLDTLKKLSLGAGIPIEQLLHYDLNDMVAIEDKPASERSDVENFAYEYLKQQISDLGDLPTVLQKDKKYREVKALQDELLSLMKKFGQLDDEGKAYVARSVDMALSDYFSRKEKEKEGGENDK